MNGSIRRSLRPACVGLSLVELLVVMAALALLAALFFPILASVREQGRKAACVSNLRQLYSAFSLYAQDYDTCLPPYDTRVGGSDEGPGGRWYPVRDEAARLVACMQPYVHSPEIWFCPSDSLAHTQSTLGGVRHQFLSYIYRTPFLPYYRTSPRTIDAILHRTHPPVREIDPADSPLLTDWSMLYDVSFAPGDRFTSPYSHSGLFNTVYLDGHVKASPANMPLIPRKQL